MSPSRTTRSNSSRGRARRLTTVAGLGVGSLLLSGAGLVAPAVASGATTSTPQQVSDRAATQIAALQQLKTSLTSAERKMDSHLAVAARERSHPELARLAPKATSKLTVAADGRTTVDIRVSAVTAALLAQLRQSGAGIGYASKASRSIRATVPVAQLETIAGWAAVRQISVAVGAMTADEKSPGAGAAVAPLSKEQLSQRVGAALRAALAQGTRGASPSVGSVESEGVRTEADDVARTRSHVNGVGVKVCALSDGVSSLAASQATGDLPAVDVLTDQAGSGDEGTAMLEIIHDMAPKATLGFATAFNGEASFADNIRALRSTLHCDVIVDDVLYFDESPFQDGPVAQAVNTVTADGALYFSSAGNEGNVLDGTSGTYEATFVGSGQTVGKFRGKAHDFAPGSATQIFDPLSNASGGAPVTLFWADPLGRAKDDYDLYAVDSEGNVLDFSQNIQNGTQDPYERIDAPDVTGSSLAVVKFSGADRYFQLQALRGRFADNGNGLTPYATGGATRGHSSAAKAFSVAAAPAHEPLPFDLEPGDPANPSGPFPGVFTSAQKPERFSSDGPRRMFFDADGSPHAQVRQKPEVTAADGVRTSVSGFDPFFGTSAAAPHAAAIAALVLSGNPGATQVQVRRALEGTAIDLAPAGVDARTGYGILRADKVLAATGSTPQPLVQVGSPTVTPLTGDGDAYLEPGESATVAFPETSTGDGTAYGVVLTLGTTPGVKLSTRTLSYGTIPAGQTKSRSLVLTLAPSYPLGQAISLTTTTSFIGRLSPTSGTTTLTTGKASTTRTTFAYAGAPVPIPDRDVAGATVPIDVTFPGLASSVTFSVDGSACTTDEGATTVGIDHTYVGDLVGTLTSPGGQSVTLFSRAGNNGNNICQAVFEDSATRAFDTATSEDAPFTGSWQPDEALSSLPQQVDGTWQFTVVDQAGGDTGSIRAVSLHIAGYDS